MSNETRNRTDEFADKILQRARGNVTTSSTASARTAPVAQGGSALRWVESGVVKSAFIWGKHSFTSPDAIFI